MAEDLEPTDGTPAAASPEPVHDLGVDWHADDTPAPGPEGEGDTSEAASQAAPSTTEIDLNTIDWLRDEVPAHLKPVQERVKQFQAESQRQTQQAQELQRQAQQERQQYLEALAQLQQTPATPSPSTDPLEQALLAASTPEEREGLSLVDRIYQHRAGQLAQQLAQQQTLLNQLQTRFQQVQQRQQLQSQQAVVKEMAAIRANPEYGDFDRYAPVVRTLYSQINPATGDYYSLEEAYLVVSGKGAARSQAQATQVAQAKRTAQQAAAPVGGLQNADLNNGRPLTEEEVIAAWDNM